MRPKNLRQIYDLLIEHELIDPTVRKALPMQIVDGFDALKQKQSDGTLGDDEIRILYECSLLLAEVKYRGSGEAAQDTLRQLYADHPGFEFRVASTAAPEVPVDPHRMEGDPPAVKPPA